MTNLSEIPVDLLQLIVLQSIPIEEKVYDNVDDCSSSDCSEYTVDSDYSGDDYYFSFKDDIKTNNGIDIYKYIVLCNSIVSDYYTYKDLREKVIQSLIRQFPQACIPTIFSSTINTQKWSDELLYILEKKKCGVDLKYALTAFENACKNNNDFAINILLEKNIILNVLDRFTQLKMLIKVSKNDNLPLLLNMLKKFSFNHYEAYRAFVQAYRNCKWNMCHILLKHFPMMASECWSYKMLRTCMDEPHKRVFVKHCGHNIIEHHDDNYKTCPGDGYTFSMTLKEPLPENECYNGKNYSIDHFFHFTK